MKDWNEKLIELNTRLEEWTNKYDTELERKLRERRPRFSFFKRDTDQSREEASAEVLTLLGDSMHKEAYAYFDQLCEHYQGSLPGARAKVRAEVSGHFAVSEWLWAYVVGSPAVLQGPDDGRRLELALLGIAIDDCRVDVLQVWNLLGELWLAATRAGIDPEVHFKKVAEVANRSMGGGGCEMRELLTDFTTSKHFRDVVRPQLKALGKAS